MTEEQKAEEKYCKNCKLRLEQCLWAWRNTNGLDMPNNQNCSCKEVPAYIAGAKENGIQWHDLRKDPNDLPKGHKVVLNQSGMSTEYDPDRGFLGFGGCGIKAWTDIPLFKE